MANCADCGVETSKSFKVIEKHIGDKDWTESTDGGVTTRVTTYKYDKFKEHYIGICDECLNKEIYRQEQHNKMVGITMIIVSTIIFIIILFFVSPGQKLKAFFLLGLFIFSVPITVGICCLVKSDKEEVGHQPVYIAYTLAIKKIFSKKYMSKNNCHLELSDIPDNDIMKKKIPDVKSDREASIEEFEQFLRKN